jgi:hypothetical protein
MRFDISKDSAPARLRWKAAHKAASPIVEARQRLELSRTSIFVPTVSLLWLWGLHKLECHLVAFRRKIEERIRWGDDRLPGAVVTLQRAVSPADHQHLGAYKTISV